MSVVIYAIIGSMAIVLESPKRLQRNYLNLFVVNVNMHVKLKNYIVYASSHTMKVNSTYVVINARTGSMGVVLAFYKVKLNILMNTFVQIVNEIVR